jgi:copper oxidase (laccase) domain-containing protein
MIKQDQPTIFDDTKLSVVVTSKSDGNLKSNGVDDLADTTSNIRAVAQAAALDFNAVVALNVGAHTDVWDEIVETTVLPNHALIALEDRVICDAMVTSMPGVVMLLPVADCNAVIVHDPVRNVLALVHLGWQSTAAELATKVVQYLQQKHHCSATDLRVYFSPAIKSDSYIFDTVTQGNDPAWQQFLRKTEKGIGIDLPGYNRQRFIDMGVPAENIQVSPVNTALSDDYFSHYRAVRSGEPDGRFAVLAMLR